MRHYFLIKSSDLEVGIANCSAVSLVSLGFKLSYHSKYNSHGISWFGMCGKNIRQQREKESALSVQKINKGQNSMAQVIRERFEMGGLEGIFVCVVKSETRGKAAILRDTV